jgi:hypothetical protein
MEILVLLLQGALAAEKAYALYAEAQSMDVAAAKKRIAELENEIRATNPAALEIKKEG